MTLAILIISALNLAMMLGFAAVTVRSTIKTKAVVAQLGVAQQQANMLGMLSSQLPPSSNAINTAGPI